MSFNADTSSVLSTSRIETAIGWMRQGFYAQAFLLLSEMRAEHSAAQFALGLCNFHAGEFDSAIRCFEQALRLIKSAKIPSGAAKTDRVYLALAKQQVDDKTYLNPLDLAFCTELPTEAEQTVLLALIHTYRQKGMADHARKLAAGLTGPVFEAYNAQWKETGRGDT